MSTRANIIIKDAYDTLYFYRHSDGYPECCGKDLEEFVKGYSDHLRPNAMQSAGHLILRGHEEYKNAERDRWKVGAYEPCSNLHGDVEYVYIIDLTMHRIETREPTGDFWDNPSVENTRLIKTQRFPVI